MAKLALIFIAVFLCVQMTLCIREKRRADEPETTTADWAESIKSGIEKTFTEENFNKGLGFFTDVILKARNVTDAALEKGKKAYEDWQASKDQQSEA